MRENSTIIDKWYGIIAPQNDQSSLFFDPLRSDVCSNNVHPPQLYEQLPIFQQKTAYVTLNQSLKRLYKLKDKLLLVLKRPEIPIHTNGNEGDIRDYVKNGKSVEEPEVT
jgi:hypothetical protein